MLNISLFHCASKIEFAICCIYWFSLCHGARDNKLNKMVSVQSKGPFPPLQYRAICQIRILHLLWVLNVLWIVLNSVTCKEMYGDLSCVWKCAVHHLHELGNVATRQFDQSLWILVIHRVESTICGSRPKFSLSLLPITSSHLPPFVLKIICQKSCHIN